MCNRSTPRSLAASFADHGSSKGRIPDGLPDAGECRWPLMAAARADANGRMRGVGEGRRSGTGVRDNWGMVRRLFYRSRKDSASHIGEFS